MVSLTGGSVLAAGTTSIPDGLTAYPLALAIRFALAAISAFTLFFAISAASTRTAGFVLAGMVAVVLGQYLMVLTSVDVNMVQPLLERLYEWPGPLAIFGGRWMLIDV
jgi:hypothetical protein